MAKLYFQAAVPLTSTETEFEFALGIPKNDFTKKEVLSNGKKIRFVPGDNCNQSGSNCKQVIGTLHTHYIKSTPNIKQTTATGITIRPRGEQISRIVHAVSEKDVNSAKDNQIVVYAIEANQIHKAMPNGRVINGMERTFNVLVDALESFAGKKVE